jgi:3-isopropylmalate dehydrogenase
MDFQITLLPGDGIGPEVIEKAVQILQIIEKFTDNRFHFSKELIGGCSIDANGTALTEEVLNVCRQSDAVLLGAVGGPKWDNPDSNIRPEQGLLALRKGLKVYANLRPVKVHPALMAASPLKEEKLSGVDMLVVRELTGGLYFGEPKGRSIINGQEHAVEIAGKKSRRLIKQMFLNRPVCGEKWLWKYRVIFRMLFWSTCWLTRHPCDWLHRHPLLM